MNIESTWTIAFQLIRKRILPVILVMTLGVLVIFLARADYFFIFVGIVIFSLPFQYYYFKAYPFFMRHFAEVNNLNYAEKGFWKYPFSKMLNQQGSSSPITNVITGTWSDFPIRMFNVNIIDSEKSEHYTGLEITFTDMKFPFISIQGKKGRHVVYVGKNTELLPIQNKYFNVYVRRGYEIEATQILSEDLMDYLSKNAQDFNIQFSGSLLSIYSRTLISNKKDLTRLFNVGKYIIDSSGNFIARLDDDFKSLHPYYYKDYKN